MTKQMRFWVTWGPVYALALLMVGLMFLAQSIAPLADWLAYLDIGLVVVGYGLIAAWLNAHPDGLLDQTSTGANEYPVSDWPEAEYPAAPVLPPVPSQTPGEEPSPVSSRKSPGQAWAKPALTSPKS